MKDIKIMVGKLVENKTKQQQKTPTLSTNDFKLSYDSDSNRNEEPAVGIMGIGKDA